MQKLYETIGRLSAATIPVLVTGETGSGKELVARAIHERGPRSAQPMRCLNCGAIPAELLESALFGHEQGAFTGAEVRRVGVFESADGGTVFLDEIGELPPAAQAALLRVLETKRFCRVGGTEEIEVDVRIIAATHRNLQEMSEEGSFRMDLLFRLNTMVLRVPPLRERPEEIVALVERFVRQANAANNRSVTGVRAEALGLLCRHRWPGNIRELKNVIDRAVIIAEGEEITLHELPEAIREAGPVVTPELSEMAAGLVTRARDPKPAAPVVWEDATDVDLKTLLRRAEAALILDALTQQAWNKTEAARALQLPLRTMTHKMSVLGIHDAETSAAEAENLAPMVKDLSVHAPPDADFKTRIQAYETSIIREVLKHAGSKAEAARRLGIPVRTLSGRAKRLGL